MRNSSFQKSDRGISITLVGRLFEFVKSRLFRGSKAYPLHVKPPNTPGVSIVPLRLGGVKMPSCRSAEICLRQNSRSAGVGPQASSAEIVCRARGGGVTGKGSVGEATSP